MEIWLNLKFDNLDKDFEEILIKCIKTLTSKGIDYSIGNDNLYQFKSAAKFLEIKKEEVLGIYLHKHIAAIFSFIKLGQVESEPIEERVKDAINYLLLFYKMIKENNKLEELYTTKDCSMCGEIQYINKLAKLPYYCNLCMKK